MRSLAPLTFPVNHHATQSHTLRPIPRSLLFPLPRLWREKIEREKRVIAGFIARRVLAAVRIGLWRLLNFDVTKSLARDRARPSSSVACMLKPFRIMMLEEELLRKLSFRIFLFFFFWRIWKIVIMEEWNDDISFGESNFFFIYLSYWNFLRGFTFFRRIDVTFARTRLCLILGCWRSVEKLERIRDNELWFSRFEDDTNNVFLRESLEEKKISYIPVKFCCSSPEIPVKRYYQKKFTLMIGIACRKLKVTLRFACDIDDEVFELLKFY